MRTTPFRPHEPSYAGVGVTWCRVPLASEPGDLEGADVVILGAPFDEGVSYRPGTRFGPRAIRTADDVGAEPGRPSMELGVDPFEVLDVVDYGDALAVPADIAQSRRNLVATLGEIYAAGAVPFVLGGDHSLSASMLEALAKAHGRDGYSVIHFDTHADTGEPYSGVRESHGTPFRTAVDDGFLHGGNIVQVGLRGAWPFPHEFQWMREQGFRWHTMGEIDERGLPAVLDDAIAHAAARAPRVYLSVDVDVLDPAYAPGTGTPEPGGLTSRELLGAVRRIGRELDLAAGDVVEVSPPYDPAGITALVANRVVLDAVTAMAVRRSGGEARRETP
jgi:agmatinase